MKSSVEKRKPSGFLDYLALALTTFGVGYIPGTPGTYGSAIAVGLYILTQLLLTPYGWEPQDCFGFLCGRAGFVIAGINALIAVALFILFLLGMWAANRSIGMLGDADPSEAVVDEVMGQLITFTFIPFIPFSIGWPFILAGFLLFRLFDVWKPYPIDLLQELPGGLGICADDIVAGVYAGICLAVGYAITLAL